jgi:predicted nucleotidyltransferase
MARRFQNATGNAAVDRILEVSMCTLDQIFPGRIRAIYLSGSYTGADATPASDIDGLVVFHGDLTDEESRRFANAMHRLSQRSGVLVDLGPRGERDLYRQGELPAKAASRRLICGDDVRAAVPAMPLWHYTSLIMRGSWFYFSLVRGAESRLAYPLGYPDPAGEFFGYERNGLHSLDGWVGPGLKAFVGGMTLAASTLVAIKAAVGVVTSADSVASYRTYVSDRWTNWLAEVYGQCKVRWAYGIPQSPPERQALRELCHQALDYENHYLAVCQQYLTAELLQPELSRQNIAAECLQQIRPDSGLGNRLK